MLSKLTRLRITTSSEQRASKYNAYHVKMIKALLQGMELNSPMGELEREAREEALEDFDRTDRYAKLQESAVNSLMRDRDRHKSRSAKRMKKVNKLKCIITEMKSKW